MPRSSSSYASTVSRSAPEDLQSSLSPSEYLILLLFLANCDSACASMGCRAESYVSKIAAKEFDATLAPGTGIVHCDGRAM